MSDNNKNKKKIFGTLFFFSTINRVITLIRESIKSKIIGFGDSSDDLKLSDKYLSIFRSPFCPNHGNFAPLLSTYFKSHKGNNTIVRYMLWQTSKPVLIITGFAIVASVVVNSIFHLLQNQYLFYILTISPIIYSMFFNAFASVLLNVNDKYASSSSGVVAGNASGLIIFSILFMLNKFSIKLSFSIILISLVLVNLLYSIVQSIYLYHMSKDLLSKSKEVYVLQDEDIEMATMLQKDLMKTFFYQSPKHLADLFINYVIKGIKSGVLSMIDASHRFISGIVICILSPIYHMSYLMLENKTTEEFKKNSGDIIFMLHMFLIPFVILFSSSEICGKFIPFWFESKDHKISDIKTFVSVFKIITYATYLSSMSRAFKNIISVTRKIKTLAISSFATLTIQSILVVMYLVSNHYDIQTTYVNASTLAPIVIYCSSIGEVLEFIYLLYNIYQNKLATLSNNRILVICISISVSLMVFLEKLTLTSTAILSGGFMLFAITNCIKYINK